MEENIQNNHHNNEKQSGILVDSDILQLGKSGHLITKNFEESCVQQAYYELRVGDIFYRHAVDETERRQIVKPGDHIIVHPHEFVTVITLETIALPTNILARVFGKTRLFSIGIIPVTNIADPGFEGHLGITVMNLSGRSVKLDYGEAFAKIEFERLRKPVSKPYKGPHNYAHALWPMPTQNILPRRIDQKNLIKNNSKMKEETMLFGEPLDIFLEKILSLEALISRTNVKIIFSIGLASSIIVYIVGAWASTTIVPSELNPSFSKIIETIAIIPVILSAYNWWRKRKSNSSKTNY